MPHNSIIILFEWTKSKSSRQDTLNTWNQGIPILSNLPLYVVLRKIWAQACFLHPALPIYPSPKKLSIIANISAIHKRISKKSRAANNPKEVKSKVTEKVQSYPITGVVLLVNYPNIQIKNNSSPCEAMKQISMRNKPRNIISSPCSPDNTQRPLKNIPNFI